MRVLVSGAAGLVGQNLIPRLKTMADCSILAVDKHAANTAVLRSLHPDIDVIEADVANVGDWMVAARECDALVMLHAQIGGLNPGEFHRNNVLATERVLEAFAAGRPRYICHVSSSVVNSRISSSLPRSLASCSFTKFILAPRRNAAVSKPAGRLDAAGCMDVP